MDHQALRADSFNFFNLKLLLHTYIFEYSSNVARTLLRIKRKKTCLELHSNEMVLCIQLVTSLKLERGDFG